MTTPPDFDGSEVSYANIVSALETKPREGPAMSDAGSQGYELKYNALLQRLREAERQRDQANLLVKAAWAENDRMREEVNMLFAQRNHWSDESDWLRRGLVFLEEDMGPVIKDRYPGFFEMYLGDQR